MFLFRRPFGMFRQCLIVHRLHPVAKSLFGAPRATAYAEQPRVENGPSRVRITLFPLVPSVYLLKQKIRVTCDSSESV